MERKYYIPKIEDIKIGLEVEYFNSSRDETENPEFNYDRWESAILNRGLVENFMKYGIGKGVRIKYLTKEDIESFGFIETDSVNKFNLVDGTIVFKKEDYLLYTKTYDIIFINKEDKMRTPNLDGSYKRNAIFNGSVNNKLELEFILKSLGIIK